MPAKVIIRNNGPVRIEGEFTVVDQDGKPFDLAGRTVISLWLRRIIQQALLRRNPQQVRLRIAGRGSRAAAPGTETGLAPNPWRRRPRARNIPSSSGLSSPRASRRLGRPN